jgi:hypothetical protein
MASKEPEELRQRRKKSKSPKDGAKGGPSIKDSRPSKMACCGCARSRNSDVPSRFSRFIKRRAHLTQHLAASASQSSSSHTNLVAPRRACHPRPAVPTVVPNQRLRAGVSQLSHPELRPGLSWPTPDRTRLRALRQMQARTSLWLDVRGISADNVFTS